MNRTYGSSHYRQLVRRIKTVIPDVSLSTDIIAGFPTETHDDHNLTLDLLHEVRYDGAFTFKYSPRENTKAWHMGDDIAEQTKVERLNEIIDVQREISFERNQELVGQTLQVLLEGTSKKSLEDFNGRTDTNKMVVFPRTKNSIGEYVKVSIERANSATLFGTTAVSLRAPHGANRLGPECIGGRQ